MDSYCERCPFLPRDECEAAQAGGYCPLIGANVRIQQQTRKGRPR